MAEPFSENPPFELNKDMTITHGPLRINFPAVGDPDVNRYTPYHCTNLINNTQTDLSPSEMALIMSIDTFVSKTREDISVDFRERLEVSYNELGIKREIKNLSHSNFGVLMHKIQKKLGHNFIDYASIGKYKMAEYPKKK